MDRCWLSRNPPQAVPITVMLAVKAGAVAVGIPPPVHMQLLLSVWANAGMMAVESLLAAPIYLQLMARVQAALTDAASLVLAAEAVIDLTVHCL